MITTPVSLPKYSRFNKRRLLRWALWLLGGIVTLLIAALIVLYSVDWSDVPISPKVQQLMQAHAYQVPDEKNSFYILRAMDADASLDAHQIGLKLVKEEEALYQADPARFDDNFYHLRSSQTAPYQKSPRTNWSQYRCAEKTANCIQHYLSQRAAIVPVLQHAVIRLRYTAMRTLGEYEEHFIPAPAAYFPAYQPLMEANEMEMAYAIFEIADGHTEAGLKRLTENDQFVRQLLRNSRSLLSRAIAIAITYKQTRVISDLIEHNPALLRQYAPHLSSLLRPLDENERDFTLPLRGEVRFYYHVATSMLISNAPLTHSAIIDSPLNKLGNALAHIFIRNNADDTADIWHRFLRYGNAPASQYAFMRKEFSANPECKSMITTLCDLRDVFYPAPTMVMMYMERGADLDGYLRLANLQLECRRQKIAPEAIADFVAQAPEPYRNPYDGTPMQWDAAAKQLQFVSRQGTSSNSSNKIYRIQLH